MPVSPYPTSATTKWVIRAIFSAPIIAIVLLNLNGFCWSQKRFLSDLELIDLAIQKNLDFHDPNSSRSKLYSSSADVRAQNPGCCSIQRQTNEDAELPQFLMRITGMYASTVSLLYQTSDTGSEKFYESYVIIGACGDVGRLYGMPTATGPKP